MRRRIAGAALMAGLGLGGCGGGQGAASSATAPSRPSRSEAALVAQHTVRPGSPATEALPAGGWDVSFDARSARGAQLTVSIGSWAPLVLERDAAGRSTASLAGRVIPRGASGGWPRTAWHVEITNTEVSVNGTTVPMPRNASRQLRFSAQGDPGSLTALLISGTRNRGALLLHRLAELHARTGLADFPEGSDTRDRIHLGDTYWTSGFWPGALWQARAIAGAPFGSWALSSTLHHFGQEHADTHDVGFMYGQSSLAAWQALCRSGHGASSLCQRLRASVLAAADELLRLAASNSAAGTIPTSSAGPKSDTIVDSMMNIAILTWASRVTGDPRYERVASRHAHRVAALLVRADGSTAQAVDFDRATGRIVHIGTHQGLSARSAWSRGEGWALYGFSQTAEALHDRALLRVALRVAAYVSRRLPGGQVPRWDYDAPAGAPLDVSAGAITAAGFFHLVQACTSLRGTCRDTGRWLTLGRAMLASTLRHAATRPPLGFLDDQVLNEHGAGCWCDGGELIFGLSYALEGLRLEQTVRAR